ncbi:MAG: hypothetical protein Q9190_001539 [Brigantiaea leucoxantha]
MLDPNHGPPTICRCADSCKAISSFITRLAYISKGHAADLVEGIARRWEKLRSVGADAQDEDGNIYFCYKPCPFYRPPPFILCKEPRKMYQLVQPVRNICQPSR